MFEARVKTGRSGAIVGGRHYGRGATVAQSDALGVVKTYCLPSNGIEVVDCETGLVVWPVTEPAPVDVPVVVALNVFESAPASALLPDSAPETKPKYPRK